MVFEKAERHDDIKKMVSTFLSDRKSDCDAAQKMTRSGQTFVRLTPRRIHVFLALNMKQILLALCALFVSALAHADSISGFLSIEGDKYIFVDIDKGLRHQIVATKVETQDSLKKLKNLDYFQGQGEISGDQILLDSIDFVGLRRLLGLWSDDSTIVDFRDYSQVAIYRSHWFSDTSAETSLVQYSIAPSNGSDWKIFFTDAANVVLASLLLHDAKATLHFYDLTSGEVTKTVELLRLPSRH